MKKTIWLMILLVLLIGYGMFLGKAEKRTVQLIADEEAGPVFVLEIHDTEELLQPWLNKRDGLYYVFLPSFVDGNKVYCDHLEAEVMVEGNQLIQGESFSWEEGQVYRFSCAAGEYPLVFMKSAHLSTFFVETRSGSLEAVNEDKEVIETGELSIVQQSGTIEYQGELKKFSARGNSTFDDAEKKAYSFTLHDSYPLCGMDAGKKWNLLAMYFEYDKIHSRLAFDMAEVLGMEYSIGADWVDLYCNGEYQGLYLLTEAVTVGEGRVDIRDLEKEGEDSRNISGGYLIEKDVGVHLEEEGNGFRTEQFQYSFIIQNPNPATKDQLEYIKAYIQKIEDLLAEGDQHYKEYLDLDSFAMQFLIDKIVLDPDAMSMSTFYHKEADEQVLKAGPLWDYDRAFGEALPDYTLSLGDYPDSMRGWYMALYADEAFREKMLSYYEKLLPFLQEMLNTGIDRYAERISASVNMDAVKWPNTYYQTDMTSYLEFESYVRYLKYFLTHRLNYLNSVWKLPELELEPEEETGERHQVQLIGDDGSVLETREVADGAVMEDLPELDEDQYVGWVIHQGGKLYDPHIPVYEDMVLHARRKFDSTEERMAYKIERLQSAGDLLSYMNVLKDEDFSVCIALEGGSALCTDPEVLAAIKAICHYQQPDWMDRDLEQKEYFLLVDNGWKKVLYGTEEEPLYFESTFGPVNYYDDLAEGISLHIQEKEENFLAEEIKGAITFVVINRYTGEVADVRAFDG